MHIGKQTIILAGRHLGRQTKTVRQTGRQTDKQADKQSYKTGIKVGKRRYTQAGRHAVIQAGKQTYTDMAVIQAGSNTGRQSYRQAVIVRQTV